MFYNGAEQPGKIRANPEFACKTLCLQDQRDKPERLECPLSLRNILLYSLRPPRPLWIISGRDALSFRCPLWATSGRQVEV